MPVTSVARLAPQARQVLMEAIQARQEQGQLARLVLQTVYKVLLARKGWLALLALLDRRVLRELVTPALLARKVSLVLMLALLVRLDQRVLA